VCDSLTDQNILRAQARFVPICAQCMSENRSYAKYIKGPSAICAHCAHWENIVELEKRKKWRRVPPCLGMLHFS
jgi:hypothetical protein